MKGVPRTSGPEQGTLPFVDLDDELSGLRDEVARLRAENSRLLRLLELTFKEARPPGPVQTSVFDAARGPVHAGSPATAKVAFFTALFAARPDVYALRWENDRSGRSGWTPAVRGGWRKSVPVAEREYLPLTEEVITAHLSGELELGLYPLLDGDRCCWLAADFDGATAMLDALAYLKAARAAGASAALEVSRSGRGAHVWLFFTAPVPAVTARQVGSGLLREAIAVRGRMDLASYDRLFPSQDVVQVGGLGNLIAAPLHGRARRRGTTVFLDLATLEPHEDQWAYLSSLGRLTPKEVTRLAQRLGQVTVGATVDRLRSPTSTRIAVQSPAAVHAAFGATITIDGADLPPPLLATLKHAASMPNPAFYERQRRRASTWDTPRFLRSYDETLTGDLILPRGLLDRLTALVEQAGSHLELADKARPGTTAHLRLHRSARPRAADRSRRPGRARARRARRATRRGQDGHRLRPDRAARRLHPRAGRPQGTGRPVADAHQRAAGHQGRAARRRAQSDHRRRRRRHPADALSRRRRRRADRRLRDGRRRRVPLRSGGRLRARRP